MKTAILIDDEHYCNETLEFELDRSAFDIQVVQKCNDPRKGKGLIDQLKPDIVFLDIEMPWLSGFELLDSLDQLNFHLVFVTAYDQFALKAFNYFAINYLLKPVDKNDLHLTLKKIYSIPNTNGIELSNALEAFIKTKSNTGLIALPVSTGFEFIDQSEIIRCEADSNYCTIYFQSRKPLLLSKSLRMIEDLLDDRFYRIHQSHLINTQKLLRIDKMDGGQVELVDGSKVPISRMRKSEFIKSIKSNS
ncbi:MAG: response regulator [Saprospiraceae bacterium]|nr:response regulator [Saprospiraceae bacterium]